MSHTPPSHLAKTIKQLRLTELVKSFGMFLAALIIIGNIPANAQIATSDTAACSVVPAYSLRTAPPDIKFRIKAKSLPPSRVMNPGESYQIRYQIRANCGPLSCHDVEETYIYTKQVLGNDPSPMHGVRATSKIWVERHDCGDTVTRIVTFTVPNVRKMGFRGQYPATVTMGVCPRKKKYSCAPHQINVGRHLRDWQVSAPSSRQRAIGGGVNRVISGVKIALTVKITNHSGRAHWTRQGVQLDLQQITGPQTNPATAITLNSIGVGSSQTARFEVGPLAPGIYTFRACLRSLDDGGGWPLPEQCGPNTTITAGAAGAGKWNVSAVLANAAGSLSSRAPAGKPFRATVFINNLSVHSYKAGIRFFTIWRSPAAGNSRHTKIFSGDLGAINSGGHVKKNFRLRSMTSGSYDFRACTADSTRAKSVDSVCGPWNTIQIGALKSGSQDKSDNKSDGSLNPQCTGFRDFDPISETCKCPANKPIWDAANDRCTTITSQSGVTVLPTCTGGKVWNKSRKTCACARPKLWSKTRNKCIKPARQRCNKPFLYNAKKRACVCPNGLTKIGNSCRRRATKGPLRCPTGATKQGNTCVCPRPQKWSKARNRCIKPARLRCNKPFLYNAKKQACVCPNGLTKIGNSCRRRATQSPLRCPAGATKQGNTCVCPRPQQWSKARNKCIKPARQRCTPPSKYSAQKRTCICPRGWRKIGNRCRKLKTVKKVPLLRCPAGASKRGNRCVCRRPAIWRAGSNRCACPKGSRYLKGRCRRG